MESGAALAAVVIIDLDSAVSAAACLPSPLLVENDVRIPCLVLVLTHTLAVVAVLHILGVDWTAAAVGVGVAVPHTLAVDLSVVDKLHILAVDWTGTAAFRILAVNSYDAALHILAVD